MCIQFRPLLYVYVCVYVCQACWYELFNTLSPPTDNCAHVVFLSQSQNSYPTKENQARFVCFTAEDSLSLSPLYLKDKKLPTISPPQHLPLSPASIHPDEQNIKPSLSCSSSPLPVHAVMLLYEHTSLLYTLHTFLPLGCQVKVTWIMLRLHSL